MRTYVRVLTLCCALLLTSCAELQPKIVTVEKAVPVACVKAIPDEPVAPVIGDADTEQLVAWTRFRANQLRQYAAQLRALLVACMEVPK